jgi:hypothetical protein
VIDGRRHHPWRRDGEQPGVRDRLVRRHRVLDHGRWTDAGIGGTGGGTSLLWGQPGDQKGVVPASMSRVRVGTRILTDRAEPGIAADADLDTGILAGYIQSVTNGKPGPYQTMVNAGTSLACPLIAALVADAQHG